MDNQYKVSRIGYVCKVFLNILLASISKRQSKKNYPKLFCLPSDYIGRNIIVSGLYEADLLHALFEKALSKFLPDFKNAIALDIGANIGNHTCYFSRFFKNVLAFEPQKAVFHVLCANIEHNCANNARAMNIGVGNRDADLPFWQNISGNLGASSFTKPDDAQGIFEQKCTLSIRQGDAIIASECANEKIALIKIDVEGLEAEVLSSLQKTIATHKPFVLFEITGGKAENPIDPLKILEAQGYHHFYAIESKPARMHSKILRFLANIINGVDVYITPIKIIENRYYQQLLASPVDLLGK